MLLSLNGQILSSFSSQTFPVLFFPETLPETRFNPLLDFSFINIH